MPTPGAGEVLLRTIWLSLDPYMRGRMSDGPSYATPVPIGGVMEGGTVSEVITSNNPGFAKGDIVLSRAGWQTHALSEGKDLRKVPYDRLPIKPVYITDGLSNAILVGEKHVPVRKFGMGTLDNSVYNGTSYSTSGRVVGPDNELARSIHDADWVFGSYHANVVQFLFADGSVHAVSTGIHPTILGRLAHHSDGNPLPPID